MALVLCGCSVLWAGRDFPAQPGETVVAGQVIVQLVPGASPGVVIGAVAPGASVRSLGALNLYLLTVAPGSEAGVSSALAASPLTVFSEPNRVRRTTVQSPNDPSFASQWDLATVRAVQAWSLLPNRYLTAVTAGTGRVAVAVLDTGIDCTHPDFKNQGGTSTDAAAGGQLLFSLSQALVATTVAGPACAWQDDVGHGTHVAGTIAAATQNGVGVAGMAYPVQVVSYKVLDSAGSGADTTIATAIIAAADAGIHIVSLSLGGPGYSQTIQAAVNYAWQRNTLVVAAAGNNGSNGLFFPAGANFAVGVSATDSTNARASFSNFGNAVDIAAPGVSILSTLPTYANTFGVLNYGFLSGTSMATPHVSALAGLVSMTTPGATAAAILQRIEQSANSTTVGGGWDQNFGYGIIDAFNAVSGTLRPASTGAVVGQVIDPSGLPLPAATVTVGTQPATLNAGGLFRVAGLAAGTYPVTVAAAGFATQNLSAAVAPGADSTFSITMGLGYGSFTGRVLDAGLPVAGAIVQALAGGLVQATTVTGAGGAYTLWAPAGTYDIRASAISKSPGTVPAQAVSIGGTAAVAGLSIAALGTITGMVRDAAANPIANALIAISGPSGTVAGAVTGVSGSYSTVGLPAGIYSVVASAAGFPDTTVANVTVSPDTAAVANVTMSGAPATAIRVNAGGPAFTDPQGQVWSADTGFTGGTVFATTAAIGNTTTPVLYQTERYSIAPAPLQYQFAVPNGTYAVTLKFAEIFF
ncbi:MAG: S8 family serine peptidase, partial [Acidobacteriia bacterium]|nr:S8 family serine peptidase [Terriglobia bacterium]